MPSETVFPNRNVKSLYSLISLVKLEAAVSKTIPCIYEPKTKTWEITLGKRDVALGKAIEMNV